MTTLTIKKIEQDAIDLLRMRCTGDVQENDHINADDIAAKTLNDLGLHTFAHEFRKIVNGRH